MAAERVASIRGDPCGTVHSVASIRGDPCGTVHSVASIRGDPCGTSLQRYEAAYTSTGRSAIKTNHGKIHCHTDHHVY